MLIRNYLPSTPYDERTTSNPHNATRSFSPDSQCFGHIVSIHLIVKLVGNKLNLRINDSIIKL